MDWLMGLCLHFLCVSPPMKIFIRNTNMRKDRGLACFRERGEELMCFFFVGNMCLCAPAAPALLIVATRGHQTAATCSASVLTKSSLSIPSAADSDKHTFLKTHWRMTRNAAATVSWIRSWELRVLHVFFVFYQCNCCFCIIRLADKLPLSNPT